MENSLVFLSLCWHTFALGYDVLGKCIYGKLLFHPNGGSGTSHVLRLSCGFSYEPSLQPCRFRIKALYNDFQRVSTK